MGTGGPLLVVPYAGDYPTVATQSSAAQPDLQYHAAVTVLWHATWTVSGAAGGGDLGTIERTTNFAVRVGEVQALNTDAN